MIEPPLTVLLPSADDTAQFAQHLAQRLRPGDCILLDGPIGAGKTHFARAAIQSVLDQPEDVPSPTFTLVQTYPGRHGEIWHCDLYRLGSAAEIDELGLLDAFDMAICLIEWPDRLGPLTPAHALHLTLASDRDSADTRHAMFDWSDPKWAARLTGLKND